MNQAQKTIIILHVLYIILILSYTAHLDASECLFDSHITQFFTLSMPSIIYGCGLWLFGWGYVKRACTIVKKYIIKHYPHFSIKGRLNRKPYFIYSVLFAVLFILPQMLMLADFKEQLIAEQNMLTRCEHLYDQQGTAHFFEIDYCKAQASYNIKKTREQMILVVLFCTIFYLISITPITIKRCHDLGFKGWWYMIFIYLNNISTFFFGNTNTAFSLFNLISTLLIVIFGLYLTFKKGQVRANKYGQALVK